MLRSCRVSSGEVPGWGTEGERIVGRRLQERRAVRAHGREMLKDLMSTALKLRLTLRGERRNLIVLSEASG